MGERRAPNVPQRARRGRRGEAAEAAEAAEPRRTNAGSRGCGAPLRCVAFPAVPKRCSERFRAFPVVAVRFCAFPVVFVRLRALPRWYPVFRPFRAFPSVAKLQGGARAATESPCNDFRRRLRGPGRISPGEGAPANTPAHGLCSPTVVRPRHQGSFVMKSCDFWLPLLWKLFRRFAPIAITTRD